MKRVLVAAVAAASTLAVMSPAHAALDTSFVGGDRCVDKNISHFYVHLGDDIDPNQIINSPFTFQEQECRVNGFRLYKSRSNTRGEANFVRKFLREDRVTSKHPVVYCRLDESHAYLLDLAHEWGLYGVKHLNAAEKRHYDHWAHVYARQHSCHLFTPQN